MLRFGTITEAYPDKGTARVKFEEDGIVSAPLPVIQRAVSGDKFFVLPSPGDQVVCLMDEHAETGAVLGSVYSSAQTPPSGAAAGNTVVVFADGTTVKYDKAGPKITVEIEGEVEVKCDKLKVTGDLDVTGDVKANGEVTARALATPTNLSTHIHLGVVPGGGVSGPPQLGT